MSARARRAIACAALVAVSTVGLTGQASASEGGASHFCDLFLPSDAGAATDPVHHYVEPYAPALHPINCQTQVQIEYLTCLVPALAFLRDPGWVFQPLFCQGFSPIL
jgi:hypothetical protein